MDKESCDAVDKEMERRYGYLRGEHPDRAKTRAIIESEPMAEWLAREEIIRDLKSGNKLK